MRHALLPALLLAGCAVAPPAPPAPVVVTPAPRIIVVHVPVAVAPPTTLPVSAAAPEKAISDSSEAIGQAKRYLAWSQSKPSIASTMNALEGQLRVDLDAMYASKRHGRLSVASVRRVQLDADLLLLFNVHKGD